MLGRLDCFGSFSSIKALSKELIASCSWKSNDEVLEEGKNLRVTLQEIHAWLLQALRYLHHQLLGLLLVPLFELFAVLWGEYFASLEA